LPDLVIANTILVNRELPFVGPELLNVGWYCRNCVKPHKLMFRKPLNGIGFDPNILKMASFFGIALLAVACSCLTY